MQNINVAVRQLVFKIDGESVSYDQSQYKY